MGRVMSSKAASAPDPELTGLQQTSKERKAPYDLLKVAILRGELKAGQVLVETALAALCQVSRTPIHEALTRLEQDGLVERVDRGLVVRRRSPEEILNIYEVRIALEATVGRVAAERRTEHEVRLLRRILDQTEQVQPGDQPGMVEMNARFHQALWHAAHNESLLDVLERLNLHLGRYPSTTLSYPGRWEAAKLQHVALVDAVEARDSDSAFEIAWHHFTGARDIRLQLWDEE